MSISQQDIQQLVREPSAEVRAAIAAKVSEGFNRSHFTENESRIAVDIFRLLLRDTAVSVRQAVAIELSTNDYVPHDIIKALASDVPEVAVHVLEHSMVLTDDDLIELIQATRQAGKWLAVSRRPHLSRRVSHTLVETEHRRVVSSLLSNDGAELDELDLETVARRFRNDQNIMETLVCRGGLSVLLVEKLYTQMSEQFKRQLTRRYRLSWATAAKATEASRELGILRFMTPWMSRGEIEQLVHQMHRNKRLHYSLVLRALCQGEIYFFEVAMAAMAHIPVENARTLMLDAGSQGFHALYASCGMPAGFAEAVKTLYRFALIETGSGPRRGREDFQSRMIDRIMAGGYHESMEYMDYFLSLLRQHVHGSARIH